MIIMHGDDQTDLSYITDLLNKEQNKNLLEQGFIVNQFYLVIVF